MKEISNVTKHKNLDSLKHYVAGPTYTNKENYNSALLSYACNEKNDENQQNSAKRKESTARPETKKRKSAENVPPENCAIPMYPSSEDDDQPNEPEIQQKDQQPEKRTDENPQNMAVVPSQQKIRHTTTCPEPTTTSIESVFQCQICKLQFHI